MKRELNKDEIDQLFDFTRKHYVEYYDVQVELVDHLASAVEEQWDEQPSLSFDEALNHVFSGFGIFGFDGIEAEKTEGVRKRKSKIWNQTFLALFKWRNITLAVLIFFFVYQLFKYFPKDFVAQSLAVIIVIIAVITPLYYKLYFKRKLQKKLILIRHGLFDAWLCYIPFYLLRWADVWLYNQKPWLLASIYTLTVLLLYTYSIASKEILKLAKSQYPEAFKDYGIS